MSTSAEESAQTASIGRKHIDLFGKDDRHESAVAELMKIAGGSESPSTQALKLGRNEHPFDMQKVLEFKTANVHHSTCIHAKTSSTVGLGFKTPKEMSDNPEEQQQETTDPQEVESRVDRVLNPLTDESFQDVLNDVCEDYWQVGNGHMEVVRAARSRTTSGGGATSSVEQGQIVGLYHLPASHAYAFLENRFYDRHWEIQSTEGQPRRFARFGDLDNFIERARRATGDGPSEASFEVPELSNNPEEPDGISEVIHFRQPTSLSRWYGFPDWLSAVAYIELVQSLLQFKLDFFLNRGVPEFMLFITGGQIQDEDWEKIEKAIQANIGLGNSHKSMALNLNNPELNVQLEKLAMESKSDDEFAKTKEALTIDIVSAHRVPPLLAGILIPGKLGATNELPNALMAFQLLVTGPAQQTFKQTLATTLGNSKLNGGLGLKPNDFVLRRIIDQMNLGAMDTVSRMREPAAGSDRDPDEGLKD